MPSLMQTTMHPTRKLTTGMAGPESELHTMKTFVQKLTVTYCKRSKASVLTALALMVG